uniref:Uncharacterized protein n=1 Tax=Sexangularia sp. CB-2014 TaxID=1486929 RepID=A0A7S1V9M6_9EUKA
MPASLSPSAASGRVGSDITPVREPIVDRPSAPAPRLLAAVHPLRASLRATNRRPPSLKLPLSASLAIGSSSLSPAVTPRLPAPTDLLNPSSTLARASVLLFRDLPVFDDSDEESDGDAGYSTGDGQATLSPVSDPSPVLDTTVEAVLAELNLDSGSTSPSTRVSAAMVQATESSGSPRRVRLSGREVAGGGGRRSTTSSRSSSSVATPTTPAPSLALSASPAVVAKATVIRRKTAKRRGTAGDPADFAGRPVRRAPRLPDKDKDAASESGSGRRDSGRRERESSSGRRALELGETSSGRRAKERTGTMHSSFRPVQQ